MACSKCNKSGHNKTSCSNGKHRHIIHKCNRHGGILCTNARRANTNTSWKSVTCKKCLSKKNKPSVTMFFWACHRGDYRHGCFHADYEGHCTSVARKGFNTRLEAEMSARKHRCRFGSSLDHGSLVGISVFSKRVK